MKVLITTSSFGKYDKTPIEKLYSEGIEIVMNPFGRKLSEEEALRLYGEDISGVVAGTEIISRRIISKASNLKVISRCGIGLDNVDLDAARERKIKIFNTPGAATDAVAELTIGLIVGSLRNIVLADHCVRSGNWKKPMGYALNGKTIGIIGLGRIGKRLVELMSGFDLVFLAYDKIQDKNFSEKFGVTYLNIKSLLEKSDVVSIHLPFTKETKKLISKNEIGLMRPCSFLINTSRADIVDENALFEALKEGRISGAALDVFENEPYNGPLIELGNLILTPHIGSYARESRVRMEVEAVENLIKGLKKKE